MNNSFPRFINDHPIGEDLFEGKSQDKIADSIISFIEDNDESKKRVIGIDGEWGSGKSNVIEIIKKKTKSKYHIFTFDTWGHQEDLTRRAFLEEFTDDLIRNKLLSENWAENLKERLATNRITITQNTPELNTRLVFLVLLILSTPLIKIGFEYIFIRNGAALPGLLSLLSTLSIVIITFLLIWVFSKKEKPTLGKLFLVYKGQQITTNKHETITSLEPSVREFRKILNDLVSNINGSKRIILVFDNMDRLPSKNVKEIWSSIHTFFAEVETNSFQSWVLIPYDQKHICKVFNGENGSDINLTISYIQKTFSIVFRVSPPILSDWKTYFETNFKKAFNFTPPPQEHLANLFDYLHEDNTIKPREILDYINNLVLLNKQWGDEIPLRYCSLFYLTKSEILDNPVKTIIERSFIKKVESIFEGDNDLEKYTSALVFNVSIDKANEVLLRRSIEKTLRGESNLQPLSNHPAFITILDSCYYNTDVNVYSTINAFNELDDNIKKQSIFEKYWIHLSIELRKLKLHFPDSENYYKILFVNLPNDEFRLDLLKYVLLQIQEFMLDEKFVFRGAKYSEIIEDLDAFFKSNSIKINVFERCPKIIFNAEDFIDFVDSCKNPFEQYNVAADNDTLNQLLISKLPSNISDNLTFLETTKGKYDYSALISQVEVHLKAMTASVSNYQSTISDLYYVYHTVAKIKPHPTRIPTNHAWAMLSANPNQSNAFDLLFSILSDIPQRPTYLSNQTTISLLAKTDRVEEASLIAEYHMTYGDIIKLAITNPQPLLIEIIKHLTLNPNDNTTLFIEEIVKTYDSIKSYILKDDKEFTIRFISNLDKWYDDYKVLIENNGFSEILNVSFVNDCSLVSNKLTQLTFEKANNYISSKTQEEWQNAFNSSQNSYLFSLTNSLLKNQKYQHKKLSEEALNAYKDAIWNIANNGTVPEDVSAWDLLLDFLEAKKLKYTYTQIRDKYIYSSEVVSPSSMYFFEKGLFAHGSLDDKDKIDDVVRKIIIPSINDNTNLENVIFRNNEKVLSIIKQSKDYLEETIEALKKRATDENRTNIEFFASNLGFQLDSNI
ncbi:MAG: P-loop NTPase fold protein [Bacteroidales bacterium]